MSHDWINTLFVIAIAVVIGMAAVEAHKEWRRYQKEQRRLDEYSKRMEQDKEFKAKCFRAFEGK